MSKDSKTHDTKAFDSLANQCAVKMHGTVSVGAKGQVVIPKEVRKLTGIEPGDTLLVITKHDRAVGLVKNSDLAEILEYMREEIGAGADTTHKNHPQ